MILQFPRATATKMAEHVNRTSQVAKKALEKPKMKRIRNTDTNGKKEKNLWTDEDIDVLLDLFGEKTVQHSLDAAKSPKDVAVKLEGKGR